MAEPLTEQEYLKKYGKQKELLTEREYLEKYHKERKPREIKWYPFKGKTYGKIEY